MYAIDPLAAELRAGGRERGREGWKNSGVAMRITLYLIPSSLPPFLPPSLPQVFPEGHVHEGCFEVFKMLYKELTEEVMRVRPKHVLIGT